MDITPTPRPAPTPPQPTDELPVAPTPVAPSPAAPPQMPSVTPLPSPQPTPNDPNNSLPPQRPPKSGSGTGISQRWTAWADILSGVGIFLTAGLVAFAIIAFVFRSYQVDGPSMQNTLQNNDKLIIWKVPRTWARITHHAYIPKRGDIVIFTESGLSQFGQTDTKQLVKRVIGLPGDRVVVGDGHYTIYNKQHPDGFNPDKTLPYFNYGKTMPNTPGTVDVTLGEGQLFVSGDNRPDSLDSRAFGPINANQIIGKLILRVFPINKAEAF
ncbi:MAG TPA: signal peptidase I [Candidatus Saccharimonadales bacterium]|nr:signal peptidase I [Candidatus Saccharimonadales bacterium]